MEISFNFDKIWEKRAIELYKDTPKFKKALAAGIAMDNALKVKYTNGGITNCHFMVQNWLKYFNI